MSINLLKIWRNEKSREIIVQIIVLIIFGWFISWLAGNVSGNFERLGKDLSFEFLFIPAGYDINQYLISYNNRDSLLRAAIVGLLNTGLVAICGIVIATIFGLFLGVLRLSKNPPYLPFIKSSSNKYNRLKKNIIDNNFLENKKRIKSFLAKKINLNENNKRSRNFFSSVL